LSRTFHLKMLHVCKWQQDRMERSCLWGNPDMTMTFPDTAQQSRYAFRQCNLCPPKIIITTGCANDSEYYIFMYWSQWHTNPINKISNKNCNKNCNLKPQIPIFNLKSGTCHAKSQIYSWILNMTCIMFYFILSNN